MNKTNAERYGSALSYLKQNYPVLGQHLEGVVDQHAGAAAFREELGKVISLTGTSVSPSNFGANSNETQRVALRALLLCQRVYLSGAWSGQVGLNPPDLTLSINHWRWRSETDIRRAIELYTITETADRTVPAETASYYNYGNSDDYRILTRSSQSFPSSNTCYSQVWNWLVQSGIASLRWMRKFAPKGTQGDYSGLGASVEKVSKHMPTPTQRIDIPRGMIVHMFTPVQPRGHWMVSDGQGYGWGANNSGFAEEQREDGEGEVNPAHARCLIHRQFKEWRKSSLDVGRLVVYDPLALDNLM